MDLTVRNHALDAARPTVVVAPDATLRSVARQLWQEGVGAAIVPGATAILGVISQRDVVAQLAVGAGPDQTTAEQAMTNVVSAQPADPVLDIVFRAPLPAGLLDTTHQPMLRTLVPLLTFLWVGGW